MYSELTGTVCLWWNDSLIPTPTHDINQVANVARLEVSRCLSK